LCWPFQLTPVFKTECKNKPYVSTLQKVFDPC